MVSMVWIGKYISTAFFTHSFTFQPSPSGSATRTRPLSRSSSTARIASWVFISCNRLRSCQAFSIIFCKLIKAFVRFTGKNTIFRLMRKTRILIASILKPVNDTRMYEKVGQSLAKLPETEIHIAGFAANAISNSKNIQFHPIFNFKRLGLSRIAAQWKYYRLLLQLKPEVIIANTFELLPVTLLYRIFSGTRILYDVRENYYANICFQPTYPAYLKPILANTVRLVEKLSALFISHFLVAERSYIRELTFLGENHTVLENKFKPRQETDFQKQFPVRLSAENLHFLYSGTISEVYGIFEALELVEKLHERNNRITFTIIGYAPQPETFEKLRKHILNKPFIRLIGGDKLVPHSKILAEIQKATVGLLPYQQNRSTENCIPTKLFEYLGNGL